MDATSPKPAREATKKLQFDKVMVGYWSVQLADLQSRKILKKSVLSNLSRFDQWILHVQPGGKTWEYDLDKNGRVTVRGPGICFVRLTSQGQRLAYTRADTQAEQVLSFTIVNDDEIHVGFFGEEKKPFRLVRIEKLPDWAISDQRN